MDATAQLGSGISCLYQFHTVTLFASQKSSCSNLSISLEDRFSASIKTLTTTRSNTLPPVAQEYHPYPRYDSEDYKRTFRGDFVPCLGPRGIRLNESVDDAVYGFIGSPDGSSICSSN